jgi:ParB family chromosome partitioning protein
MVTESAKSMDATRKTATNDLMSILANADSSGEPRLVKLANLVPYANHPFVLYDGDRLDDMVRSVKEMGIIVPLVARPTADRDTYEILSGHNRANAASIAGLDEVPVVIRLGLTDEEAALIVTETNLMQRSFEDLKHSERAIAIKHRMDSIKKQGKKSDFFSVINLPSNPHDIRENGTSCQVGTKAERSNERAGKEYNLSARNVARYLRIAELIPPLQTRLDNEEIAFNSSVTLSYLSREQQEWLNGALEESLRKVDMKKAESLRTLSEGGKLTKDKILQILSGEALKKPGPKSAPPLKISASIYRKYFDEKYSQREMEGIVEEALTAYFAAKGYKEGG